MYVVCMHIIYWKRYTSFTNKSWSVLFCFQVTNCWVRHVSVRYEFETGSSEVQKSLPCNLFLGCGYLGTCESEKKFGFSGSQNRYSVCYSWRCTCRELGRKWYLSTMVRDFLYRWCHHGDSLYKLQSDRYHISQSSVLWVKLIWLITDLPASSLSSFLPSWRNWSFLMFPIMTCMVKFQRLGKRLYLLKATRRLRRIGLSRDSLSFGLVLG